MGYPLVSLLTQPYSMHLHPQGWHQLIALSNSPYLKPSKPIWVSEWVWAYLTTDWQSVCTYVPFISCAGKTTKVCRWKRAWSLARFSDNYKEMTWGSWTTVCMMSYSAFSIGLRHEKPKMYLVNLTAFYLQCQVRFFSPFEKLQYSL